MAYEVNAGSDELRSVNNLTVPNIDIFDCTFFNFLADNNCQHFKCEWNRLKQVLNIKYDTEDEKENARQLVNTVSCSFKETYTLSEKEMTTCKEFLRDINTNNDYSDVFLDATTNSNNRRFVIMATNGHDEMFRECKHKFEVKIGRKRMSRRSMGRKNSLKKVFKRQTSQLRSSEKKHEFTTFEKIDVKIVTDNLENLDGHVEGIVNPIDNKLDSKGQVSKLLTVRGGEKYVHERKRTYSAMSESIGPGSLKCFTTGAGDLKAKKILHVVCPTVHTDKDTDVENVVFNTVYNCLKTAEGEMLDSVAIPLLYTGHGNVPVDRCAVPYALAVLEFSRKRVNTFVVNTIIFIDLDENKTNILAEYFDELLPKTVYQLLEIPVKHNGQSNRLQADSEVCPTGQSQTHSICTETQAYEEPGDNLKKVTEQDIIGDRYANDEGYEEIGIKIDETQLEMTVSNSLQTESQNSDPSKRFEDNETVDTYDTIPFADDLLLSKQKMEDIVNHTTESENLPKTAISDDGYDTIQDITVSESLKKDVPGNSEQLKQKLLIIDETNIDKANNTENEDHTEKDVVTHCDTEQGIDENHTESQDEPLPLLHVGIDQASLETWANIDGGDVVESIHSKDSGKDCSHDTSMDEVESVKGITKEETPLNKDINEKSYCYIQTEETAGNIPSGHRIQSLTKVPLEHDYYNLEGECLKHTKLKGTSSDGIHDSTSPKPGHHRCVSHQTSNYFQYNVTDQAPLESWTNIDGGDVVESIRSEDSDKGCSHNTFMGEVESVKGITKEKTAVNKDINETLYCYIRTEENAGNISSEQQIQSMTGEVSLEHDYYNLEGEFLKHTKLIGASSEGIHGSTSPKTVHHGCLSHQTSKYFQYNVTDKVSVEILKNDIRNAQVDVVVCPEIKDTKYGGVLAVAIKSAYRNKTGIETPRKLKKSKGKRIATTNCHTRASASESKDENVNFIYHVQTPVYKISEEEKQLTGCIDLVFRKLKKHRDRHVKRIAFPLLGIEDVSEENAVLKCCEILAKTVYKSCHKYEAEIAPLEVMLINRCGQITEMLNKEMKSLIDPPIGCD